jgi:hypothetical protein
MRSSILTHEKKSHEYYYEYLIFLEDKVARIVQHILENPELESIIRDDYRDEFLMILNNAAEYSHFRIPNERQALRKALSKESSRDLRAAYRKLDVIEDAFDLFAGQRTRKKKWDVDLYFHTLERYKIPEIREIVHTIKTTTSWEEPFLSRIENTLKSMTYSLADYEAKSIPGEIGKIRKNVTAFTTEIFRLKDNQKLSPAAFYEILRQIAHEIIPEIERKE